MFIFMLPYLLLDLLNFLFYLSFPIKSMHLSRSRACYVSLPTFILLFDNDKASHYAVFSTLLALHIYYESQLSYVNYFSCVRHISCHVMKIYISAVLWITFIQLGWALRPVFRTLLFDFVGDGTKSSGNKRSLNSKR